MQECSKVLFGFIKAREQTTIVFQIAEQAFDFMTLFIKLFVIGALFDPIIARRDMRRDAVIKSKVSDVIAVIAFVSQQMFGFHFADEWNGLRCIVALSGGDNEVKWIAQRVAHAVDLGRKPAARAV